jgi:hypothetical protein
MAGGGCQKKTKFQEKLNMALTELQSAAVKGAIASAYFTSNADNLLLEALTGMNELTENFKKQLRKTSENIWEHRGPSSLEWRRKIKESPSYLRTKEQATLLLRLLVEKYGLDPNRQFFGTQAPSKEEKVAQ